MLSNPYIENSQMIKNGYIKLKNKNLVCMPLYPQIEEKFLNYSNWEMFGGVHDAL